MKKLLSLLTITGLTATTATSVVACDSSDDDAKHKMFSSLSPSNSHQVVLKYGDSALEVGDLPGLTGDNAKNLILDWINTNSTTRYSRDVLGLAETTRLKLAEKNNSNLIEYKKDNTTDPSDIDNAANYYNQEVTLVANQLTLEKLFTDYTRSVSTEGKNALDDLKEYYYYGLNPDKYLGVGTERDDNNENNLSIWFSDSKGSTDLTRWVSKKQVISKSTFAKSQEFIDDLSAKKYLPNGQQLTNGDFYVVKDQALLSDENLAQTDLKTIKANLGANILNPEALTGREGLALRFANYILNTPKPTEKIMAVQYLKGDLYKIRTNGGDVSENLGNAELENLSKTTLFLNRDSLLAKDTQTWTDGGRPSYTPNYKMVWAFSLPKDKQPAINYLLNNSYVANSSNNNDVMNMNTVRDNTLGSLVSAFGALKENAGSDNLNTSGLDSLFEQSGFQGIVKNSGGSVESVLSGDLKIDDSAKQKLAKVNGPSFLVNKIIGNSSEYDFTFQSVANAQEQVDVIIALPIYLQDLFGTQPATNTPVPAVPNTLNNLALDTWVELNPQSASDTWTSGAKVTGGSFTKYEKTNEAPTTPSYYELNNKTFVYVPSKDKDDSLTVNLSTQQTISFKWIDQTSPYFGIKGVYQNSKTPLNGQTVEYKLHIGDDTTNPDNWENDWTTNFAVQNTPDILKLANDRKQILFDNLLYLTAHGDSQAIENAKNGIYKRYLNPNDIWYQPIYDALIKYIKVNDEDEESD